MEYKAIEDLDKATRKLVKFAMRVRKRAYAPYSKFFVGTAVLDNAGKVHTGCNVENASYPNVLCAEPVALGKMITRGGKECKKLVVVTSNDEPVFPCGSCLQITFELGRKAVIYAVNRRGTVFLEAPISQLLPYGMSKESLPK